MASNDRPEPSPSSSHPDALHAEALALLGQRKKRKRRVRYSCTECHRRKHKCDRETPCGKCVERGVASSCVPFDGDEEGEGERLRRLEGVLAKLVGAESGAIGGEGDALALGSSNAAARNGKALDHASTSVAAAITPTPLFEHGPSMSSSSSSASANHPRRLSKRDNPGITTAASLPFRAQIGSETLEFSSSTHTYPPSAHFERLVREDTLAPSTVRDLCSALPTQAHTMTLLEVFFRDINPLMFPFDEVWFREALHGAVDVIWGDDDGYGQDGPNQLSIIALLFAVLALTLLSQPPSLGGQEAGAAQAAKMGFHCRRALMLAETVACHDAFAVLAQLLLARYLILLRQAKESWLVLGSAVRQAQALGFHRLGPPPEAAEAKEVEMRRVIWLHLFFEDRFSSLIVGQAPLVHDAFCTTTLGPRPRAAGVSARFELDTILRVREEMTRIVGRMLELYFSNTVDLTYEAILQLDAELTSLADNLPSPYRRDEHPDLAGVDGRTIALHRYILHVSLAYLSLSLHLPYLRRGAAERGFDHSRASALQAAIWDHAARQELSRLEWPPHVASDAFVGGRFFHFHATSALGVCLLSEPDLARVRQLLALMDEFLERAEQAGTMKGVDPNRCIRQEIGIVSLIRGRVRRRLAEGEVHRTSQNHGLTTRLSQEEEAPTNNAMQEQGLLTDTMPELGLPEMGQDVYEWWSWLVASLTPDGGIEPVPR